jgi:hypothetical protein
VGVLIRRSDLAEGYTKTLFTIPVDLSFVLAFATEGQDFPFCIISEPSGIYITACPVAVIESKRPERKADHLLPSNIENKNL